MLPLIPFIASIAIAIISDSQEKPEEYGGQLPSPKKRLHPSKKLKLLTQGKTRFALAKRFKRRRVAFDKSTTPESEETSDPTSSETDTDTENKTEEYMDPEERVLRQIKHELIMDEIADDVLDEMALGEWDHDLEERLIEEEDEAQEKAWEDSREKFLV
jgi:hypothetical protein